MLKLQDYLKDPCLLSSIPYWKAKIIKLPSNFKVIHEKDYSIQLISDYTDEKYFRLVHDLKKIEVINLDGYEIVTAREEDANIIVSIINESYEDLQVNLSQIQG